MPQCTGSVKEVKPELGIGWHIWHNNSFSPIYRAEQDLSELHAYSDFLKMVMYHNCGGERMAGYIRSVGHTIYGDVPGQELLDFHYRVMDYAGEKRLDEIAGSGLSADYVYREAKRARGSARGEPNEALARHRYRHPHCCKFQQVFARGNERRGDCCVSRRRRRRNPFQEVLRNEAGKPAGRRRRGPAARIRLMPV